jgi:hypothetical protein
VGRDAPSPDSKPDAPFEFTLGEIGRSMETSACRLSTRQRHPLARNFSICTRSFGTPDSAAAAKAASITPGAPAQVDVGLIATTVEFRVKNVDHRALGDSVFPRSLDDGDAQIHIRHLAL